MRIKNRLVNVQNVSEKNGGYFITKLLQKPTLSIPTQGITFFIQCEEVKAKGAE